MAAMIRTTSCCFEHTPAHRISGKILNPCKPLKMARFDVCKKNNGNSFFFRHMYPTPSPIFAGGANGSYVRAVSFSHDARHIATVCDDS